MALLGLLAIGVNWASAFLASPLASRAAPSRTRILSVSSGGGSLSSASSSCLIAASCSPRSDSQLGQLETGVGVERQVGEGGDQVLVFDAGLRLGRLQRHGVERHVRRRHGRRLLTRRRLLGGLVLAASATAPAATCRGPPALPGRPAPGRPRPPRNTCGRGPPTPAASASTARPGRRGTAPRRADLSRRRSSSAPWPRSRRA